MRRTIYIRGAVRYTYIIIISDLDLYKKHYYKFYDFIKLIGAYEREKTNLNNSKKKLYIFYNFSWF